MDERVDQLLVLDGVKQVVAKSLEQTGLFLLRGTHFAHCVEHFDQHVAELDTDLWILNLEPITMLERAEAV